MTDSSQQNQGFPEDGDMPPALTNSGAVVKWGLVAVVLIVALVVLSFLKSVYTDWLWYGSLDFRSVYVKVMVTRIVLFALGAAVAGLAVGVAIYFAHRQSAGPPVTFVVPPESMGALRKMVAWGGVVAAVLLAVIFGGILASNWEIFLKFLNASPFGEADPVYGRDLSFFVLKLPLYQLLQGWLLGLTIMTLLAVGGMVFVNHGIRGLRFELSAGLKVQLSIIAAVILFAMAWGHWLDRWELLLSDQGRVFGATYTDLNARRPALLIMTIVAAVGGILMLVNAYTRGMRLMVGAGALWLVMAILLTGVWPALMQQFTVMPNEFDKEEPYILRNIDFTRKGFGLHGVEEVFFPVDPSGITPELVNDNPQTINNIRLWDGGPLSNVYRQIQLIRPYYDFKDADVDRYTLGDEYRQVLLSAREVAPEKLSDEAQTWINRRLVYTHGIGIAMSPVTEFTPEGRPEFFAQDIPSNGVIPISTGATAEEPALLVDNPRIYYGENTLEYVIVNTNTEELDYQTEEGELFRTSYFGQGGVRLNSVFRRAAYAWEFGDVNILISGEITGDSRVQYRREIQERISKVAPFLLLDEDPYIVAADGGLFWVQDAYMTSDRYPYSEMNSGESEMPFNYIRNSVKITVDAFHGTIKFYVWDPTDPVVRTYEKIFPGLFSPKESMSPALQEHVRYPQDLFTFQAEQYRRYHMLNPQDFYFDEDLWAIPNEKFGQSETLQVVEPYYVIMKLPEEEEEEFMQLLPYTPNQRQNLIGWLAARSDGDNYGKLIAFNFPKDRQVDGPEQVEARIDNDQDISAWFTLRCTQGSTCIRGNLLVIPLGNSILYAEPVYIQAEGVTFPELKRVILGSGEKIVMEDSLREALESLIGEAPAGVGEVATTDGSETRPATVSGIGNADIEALREAIDMLEDDLTSLEEALQRIKEIIGGE